MLPITLLNLRRRRGARYGKSDLSATFQDQSFLLPRNTGRRPMADLLRLAAATGGLTALAAAGMAMWELHADLGLVEHGDHLVVKDILSGDQAVQTVAI